MATIALSPTTPLFLYTPASPTQTAFSLPPLSALPPSALLPRTPTTPSPLPVDFLEILENWHIPSLNISLILPSTLQPSHELFNWTDALREAIRELSKETVGQRERAHRLLETFFQARIREGIYEGADGGTVGELEVGDVEKVVESVRRMSRGRDMEREGAAGVGVVKEKETEDEGAEAEGKRKYSIRQEVTKGGDEQAEDVEEGGNSRPTKMQRMDSQQSADSSQPTAFSAIGFSPAKETLPTLPHRTLEGIRKSSLPSRKTKPRTLHLPPILTTDITTPTLPAVFSHHTNLVQDTHSSNTYSPNPRAGYVSSPPQHLLQDAQRATHEFNVRRMEYASAEAQYEGAKQRYVDAARRMDWARKQVEGWR